MGRPRTFDSAFKAKLGLEALQEKEPLQALSKKYGVNPTLISRWTADLLLNSQRGFEPDTVSARKIKPLESNTARLERKVGQLTLECDFFASACEDAGLKVR